MAEIDVILPKMGESVAEATITNWLKSVGYVIKEDEPIIEIATDKVDSEVPAPASGILKKMLFNEGDVVQVGAVFAIIGTEGDEEEVVDKPEAIEKSTESLIDNIKAPEPEVKESLMEPLANGNISHSDSTIESNRFYSPLVKSIAEKEGIAIKELETIKGTGSGGRVTKKDMLSFLKNLKLGLKSQPIVKSPKDFSASQQY